MQLSPQKLDKRFPMSSFTAAKESKFSDFSHHGIYLA
jgi:hypothetical protein